MSDCPKKNIPTNATVTTAITLKNDWANKSPAIEFHSKSKPLNPKRLNVNPATMQMIPAIPATPNPGITKISNSNKITPTTKRSISQIFAVPSIIKGVKKNIAPIKDIKIQTPKPGVLNSK